MEINLNVTFGMAPSMTATIRALLAAPLREEETERLPERSKKPEKTRATEKEKRSKKKEISEKVEDTEAPAAQECVTPAPATETAPATEAPAPEYREKPEDVLPLLRERFAIPKNKEDRDDQQQALAKELNRAVIGVIREVTKNTGAKSISDLRTDDDRREFIRMALLITYDVGTGKFKTMPF